MSRVFASYSYFDKSNNLDVDSLNLDTLHHCRYEFFFVPRHMATNTYSNYPKDSMFDKMDKFDLDGLNQDSFHHYRYDPFFASVY